MTVGVIESQMTTAAAAQGLRLRHHLRHGQGVRLRFSPRPAAAASASAKDKPIFWAACWGTRATRRGDKPVQRPPHFILVDEADSILIDEARTPLIISALPTEPNRRPRSNLYKWAAQAAPAIRRRRALRIRPRKEDGRTDRRRPPPGPRSCPSPPACTSVGMFTTLRIHRTGDRVDREFILDRQYVVRDGEIVIVDEFTGRISEGRKWRDGIHQAVEAKEDVEVTVETGQAARVTVQDYFLLLSAPGRHDRHGLEFGRASCARSIGCGSCRFRPIGRRFASGCPTRFFGTADGQVARRSPTRSPQIHAAGRPVLIGTRSIDKSEILSRAAHRGGHRASGAQRPSRRRRSRDRRRTPARRDRVTVSTNMAGRGTDIKLGRGRGRAGRPARDSDRNARLGPHRSPVDRPLRPAGRSRQLPPIPRLRRRILLAGLGPDKAEPLAERGRGLSPFSESAVSMDAAKKGTVPFAGPFDALAGLFRKAQRRIERRHFRDRKALMYHEKSARNSSGKWGKTRTWIRHRNTLLTRRLTQRRKDAGRKGKSCYQYLPLRAFASYRLCVKNADTQRDWCVNHDRRTLSPRFGHAPPPSRCGGHFV